MSQKQVVIVGGGFAGINAAKALKNAPVQITLIDRRNHHLFQPLLYQVATGVLSPADIASPLRVLLKNQKNARVLLDEVVGFDAQQQQVLLRNGAVGYDVLIVAAGAGHHYFGNDQWERWAPPLKTVEDAVEIRRRVLSAFEKAEQATDPETIRSWLTFVIVGGGPTGVEMAGALADIATQTLRHDFRNINPAEARIILVQSPSRILTTYAEELSQKGKEALERRGVIVRTGARMTDVGPQGATLSLGEENEFIAARTVLWAAGVKANPLGKALAEATAAEVDRGGRVIVNPDLSVPGYENIFVAGDLAHYAHHSDTPLPGVAQVAIQQGYYIGQLLQRRWRGQSTRPFHYKDRGNMAKISRSEALVEKGRFRLTGLLAWHVWWIVHLMYLVGFRNRLIVFLQWAWGFFTHNRSALLITNTAQSQEETATTPLEVVASTTPTD